MLGRDHTVSGLKVGLLANLGLFLEGTCRGRLEMPGQEEKDSSDFVDAVLHTMKTTHPVQLSIPFPD
jgi:hypothetical protein